MSDTTVNEQIPYSLETDFSDVQDWYNLATQVDADARVYADTFAAGPRPLAFLRRTSAASGGFSNDASVAPTFDVNEFDNTGAPALLTGSVWSQPTTDVPSWWMVGAYATFTNVSGTPTISDRLDCSLEVFTVDPVSGIGSLSVFEGFAMKPETTTGGESFCACAVVPMYRGYVSVLLGAYGTSTAVRSIAAGARMWGFRLGPVG